jgi:aminoglycoside phosphotransferase (APT) family kinase protein
LGGPTPDRLAGDYARATGVSVDDLDYWWAFNAWRSGVIAEGVHRRYLDGHLGAASEDIEVFARKVPVAAADGLAHAGLASPVEMA